MNKSSEKRIFLDHPRIGVGFVLCVDKQIVLVKRQNSPAKGEWTLPGGMIELGESPEQAVLREAKEELTVECEIVGFINYYNFVELTNQRKIKYHFIILDFLLKIKNGCLKASSDAQSFKLVSLNQIDKVDILPSARQFLKTNQIRIQQLLASEIIIKLIKR